jgi:DNA-binding transcriptional LysR family regulator
VADRKRTDLDWQDIRVFLALARHGSLSAAARGLSVTHATIARRLRSLEASLGEDLVERRPEGYVLTPAGTRALDAASDMEQAAQTLGRADTDGAPRGLVRINAPPGLAQGFLIAQLSQMSSRYAGLDIDLATNLRSVSLERHEADIAIRVSRPEDGDVIAKSLVNIGYGFYGTEDACRRVEGGAEPVFVGFDEAGATVPEAVWLARQFPQARLAFRASNQSAQAIAARSGVGIVLLPHYIGRADAALRFCDLGKVPPAREVFIVTRRRDRKDASIMVVAENIIAIFARERALFE